MKKEDFKKITEEHIEVCEIIKEQKGACNDIECSSCPFELENWCNTCLNYNIDETFELAKEFIKKFKK